MLFSLGTDADAPKRVVITGAGVVTALGLGWEANAKGFAQGRRAFRPVTLFDVSRQRVKVAAEVDLPDRLPATRLGPRPLARMDRAAKLLLLAGSEAWHQSGWQPNAPIAVVLGTTSGGMSLGEDYFRRTTETPACSPGQASRIVHYQCQRQGLDLAEAFGFQGSVTIIANACASGANAIGHAWDLLRRSHAQRVLTGGFDALSQLVFAGFDSLQALSPTQCRPFDGQRDGLALGEGAAVFAMETLEAARERGARILGELVGYAAATDSHHLTQPHPDGAAALRTMQEACRRANLHPSQIDYVNAHGTGTLLNDAAEAAAINAWAGERVRTLAVSSTKSSIGHLLGAAGAVEFGVCLMALHGQWMPPTTTLRDLDPAVAFNVVREPTTARLEYALTNSFGFGGATASLILRRWS